MISYMISDIDDDINNKIKILVKNICKENKINYKKQNYKILFSNEKILFKNNLVKFTSGSKKHLSFYGKIYSNKNKEVLENIYLEDNTIQINTKKTNIIIFCGGIKNSTIVEVDEELLYFYVAPSSFLQMQKPDLWQSL